MKQYLGLLDQIIEDGNDRDDRTGVGTRGLFGNQLTYDLTDGFPLLTTKKLSIKNIIHDMLWMLSGSTNIKYLNDNDVHIWDPWADENGEVGPVYGKQWRKWPDDNGNLIDQINTVVTQIKTNPSSRRLIVSAWNVADLDKMAIPPCPVLFQFYVHNNILSCHLYQRSADVFIGLPFNIAGFALLTEMIAHVCNLKTGKLIHSFGDVHLYKTHITLAKKQLCREPFKLPKLILSPEVKSVFDFKYDHIKIECYKAHPFIKSEIAI